MIDASNPPDERPVSDRAIAERDVAERAAAIVAVTALLAETAAQAAAPQRRPPSAWQRAARAEGVDSAQRTTTATRWRRGVEGSESS